MKGYEPRWDLDKEWGDKGEIWAGDIREGLQGGGTIEVKNDRRAIQTGHLYVEYECKGRPSGLATSKALFWMFIIDLRHCAIVLSTERLKDVARRAYQNPANRRQCRDGSHPTKGVVIPLAHVIQMAVARPLILHGGAGRQRK